MSEFIEFQCKLLKIPPNKSKFKIYFYALKLDGKLCIKPGKSKQELSTRINQYLFIEHSKKSKNMETFMLIAVYEFDSEDIMKNIENLIKSGFNEYPLNKDQHGNTEQYLLEPSWNHLKGFINNMPFSKNSWIHPNVNNAIDNLIKNNSDVDTDSETNSETSLNNDDYYFSKKNSTKWIIKLNNLLENNIRVKGIGPKTWDIFRFINSTTPINRISKENACKDIKKKMQSFNKQHKKSSQYHKIIEYITSS